MVVQRLCDWYIILPFYTCSKPCLLHKYTSSNRTCLLIHVELVPLQAHPTFLTTFGAFTSPSGACSSGMPILPLVGIVVAKTFYSLWAFAKCYISHFSVQVISRWPYLLGPSVHLSSCRRCRRRHSSLVRPRPTSSCPHALSSSC